MCELEFKWDELKAQITIRIDRETTDYFKKLAVENGVSYQNLIDLYMSDRAHKKKKLTLHWS